MAEVFFGRDRELATASALIGQARAGNGAVLCIAAASGLGKTSLMQRVADMARDQEFLVLFGLFAEARKLPSLGPWRRILEKADQVLPGEFDTGRLIAENWGSSSELEGITEVEKKFALFEKIGRHFVEISRKRSLFLAIEDLHASDSLSFQLLIYLIDALEYSPVLFGISLRPEEFRKTEISRELDEVLRRSRFREKLELQTLSEAEIQSAFEARGGPFSPQELYRWTRGIPYLLTLLTRYGVQPGSEPNDGDLSARCWTLIEKGLASKERDIVVRLALVGNRTSVEDLALGAEGGQIALKELFRLGLVRESENRELQLFHDDFAEAVLAQLGKDEKNRLLADLVENMERRGRGRDEGGILVLKRLCAQSAAPALLAKALEYRRRSADEYLRRGAWEEAESELRVILRDGGNLKDEFLWEIKYLLCSCLVRGRRFSFDAEDAALLISLVEQCYFTGEDSRFTELIAVPYFVFSLPTGIEPMIRAVLARLPDPSPERVRLLLSYSAILFERIGCAEQAGSFTEEALTCSREQGWAIEEAAALTRQALYRYYGRDPETALAEFTEILSRHRTSLAWEDYHVCLIFRGAAWQAMGRLEQARQSYLQVLNAQTLYQSSYWMTLAERNLQRLELFVGRWEDVCAYRIDDPRNFLFVIPHVVAHCLQGDFDQADAIIVASKATMDRMFSAVGPGLATALAWMMACRIYLSGEARWVSEVEAFLDQFLGRTELLRHQCQLAVCAGRIARRATDGRHGRAALAALETGLSFALEEEDYSLYAARALLLEREGRIGEAQRSLEGAVRCCESCGERPWKAYHGFELARLLGKGERATRLLNAAEIQAVELGLKPLRSWLRVGKGTAAHRPPEFARTATGSEAVASPGITAREREVLIQLSRGLSDKEIANQLHVSPYTVGNHLRNIYAKLGKNSRLEAAQWALRSGLVAPGD